VLAPILLAAAAPVAAAPAERPADLVLTGVVTGADHQRYLERPFRVPKGVRALRVTLTYDRGTGTVIDLGLLEDGRPRGWSGGNKASFVIGETRATPSYHAGPIAGRRFALLLGIPNARPGSRTTWRAEIRFERAGALPDGPVLADRPGWYRGDLHTHTGHSDGSCARPQAPRAPCPVHRTAEAAARAGLDFVAVTDHNTVSHLSELEALQPGYPRLLLIPGQEITTFHGHANLIGATALAPFRVVQAAGGKDWSRAVGALGGVLSINHPGLPSGEACMGCGWTMTGVDWSLVHAVEVANGGVIATGGGRFETPLSGLKFWEARLADGRALAPVAGSDNHDAGLAAPHPRAIGRVATVVWADALSVAGIANGIRRGRVFVDLENDPAHLLDLSAGPADRAVAMGGTLTTREGDPVPVRLSIRGCRGCTAELVADGVVAARLPVADAEAELAATISAQRWLRAQARKPDGTLLMLSAAVLLTR
jgi:hypothetical protein